MHHGQESFGFDLASCKIVVVIHCNSSANYSNVAFLINLHRNGRLVSCRAAVPCCVSAEFPARKSKLTNQAVATYEDFVDKLPAGLQGPWHPEADLGV